MLVWNKLIRWLVDTHFDWEGIHWLSVEERREGSGLDGWNLE
jgi:hypothetical protein